MNKGYKWMILPLFISYQTLGISYETSNHDFKKLLNSNEITENRKANQEMTSNGNLFLKKTNHKKRDDKIERVNRNEQDENSQRNATKINGDDTKKGSIKEKPYVANYRVKESNKVSKKENKSFLEIENSLGKLEEEMRLSSFRNHGTEFGLKVKKMSGTLLCGLIS